jgi:hypothetical protein
MGRTNDLIFAPGKWSCLGKGLAFTVLNKVFKFLLRLVIIVPMIVDI